MTYFTADPNVWYSVTTHVSGSDRFIVPNAFVGQDHALVNTFAFDTPVDLTGWVGVQWQFFPVTEPANGTYFLRNRMFEGGWFNSYSPTQLNATACSSQGWDCSIGLELNTILPVGSVWTFEDTQADNGTWYITNYPYGSNSRLDLWPTNLNALRMTTNITGVGHPGQYWSINEVMAFWPNQSKWDHINPEIVQIPGYDTAPPDAPSAFTSSSSISSSGATSTSTSSGSSPTTAFNSTTSPTSTVSPSNVSHASGLSTGAKAGIGAGVGVAALLALILLLLFLLRRHKTRKEYEIARSDTSPQIGYHPDMMYARNDKPAEDVHDEAPLVEAHSEAAVEVLAEPGRYELEGDLRHAGVGAGPRTGSDESL